MLASDNIPLALLLSQPPLLPPLLMDAAADPIRRTEVIGTLYQQGLLVRDVGDTVRMHRLIQAVVLSHRSDGTRREVIAKAVEILAKLFPNGVNPDQWPQCQQLMAHVQALLEHTLNHAILSQALVDLWTKYGVYLHCRGLDIRLAREPLEQALAVCMRLYEGDHPEVARSLSNLAVDLSRRGAHERALELDERALAMRQRLYEGDHPEVARSLSNLAVALSRRRAHERALELDERALAMRQRLYEGDHPDVATSMNNLASELRIGLKIERALELDERALAMRQRLYQGDHPDIAASLGNLAVDLTFSGDFKRALKLADEALAMRDRLYEGDHPDAAASLEYLSFVVTWAGNEKRARMMLEKAKAMRERLTK